jgi:UDP-glucose 4-epimerase
VFGNDYPTHDGTGVRDYIHVMDLARAHVDAIDYLESKDRNLTVNLGTGHGYSVLDIMHTFEHVSKRKIPFEFCPRRAGDVAICYADPGAAAELMGWHAQFGIERMCEDAWRWQSLFPRGYAE